MNEAALRYVLGEEGYGFVIQGIREDGSVFRPGDWIERLVSLASTFGPNCRLRYSPLIQPCMIQGQRCLVMAGDAEWQHPEIYNQILKFALDNRLRTRSVGGQRNEPTERKAA